MRALARATGSDTADSVCVLRAEHVLACISPGGLSRPSELPAEDVLGMLDRQLLEGHVRHPLARGSGRLATRLSELIAAVPEPDLGFLRDFCEELLKSRYPDAERALGRSSLLFGLPRITAYVSHGARSVGLRAFGSREPFILIGERHLTAGSPYALTGAEFEFALGAELAHLAFGHQRVTAGEIWAGAAGKTREALTALGLVLPVLAELGSPRAQRVFSRLGAEAVQQAMRRASRLPELFGDIGSERERPALGQRNEELIAAHRLVQLTADRAGLVMCQHLESALRAVLLTRSDYREVLIASETEGLWRALGDRRAEGAAFADLGIRLRALIAFYLAADFDVALRARNAR